MERPRVGIPAGPTEVPVHSQYQASDMSMGALDMILAALIGEALDGNPLSPVNPRSKNNNNVIAICSCDPTPPLVQARQTTHGN